MKTPAERKAELLAKIEAKKNEALLIRYNKEKEILEKSLQEKEEQIQSILPATE